MKEKKKIEEILSQLTEEVKGEIVSEKELQEAREYAIKDYPRLVQLARAGLVPEPQLFKILYFLKDPKRFGVTPKVRNQLYDVMIKTLNYIVATDPAAWARFRAFLLKGEDETEGLTEMRMNKKDILKQFKSAIREERYELSSVKSLRASVELSEKLMLEAERHESGTHWEASTGNSWGAKNRNGETIYYNESTYKDAEVLAKAFATGNESKAVVVEKKKEMERSGKGVTRRREGQLFETDGVKRTGGKKERLSTKDIKLKSAAEKGLDGPDSPKQALESSVKKEKEVATRMFKIAEVDMNIEDLVDESNIWGDELGLERKSSQQQVGGQDKETKKETHEPSVGEILNESLTKTIGRILKEELAKYSMYA